MDKFLLPDLGEGLEDAEIVAWHVAEGDNVVADQPLVSVETDKAVVEVPSPHSGQIKRLYGAVGDVIKVGAPLVEFTSEAGEDTGTVVGKLERQHEAPPAEPGAAPRHGTAARVTPAVRALARKLDVDLEAVAPSGPGGSITRADVERAAKSISELGEAEPLRGMRRAMAQRMVLAHREVVPAGVTDEADIGDWSNDDITARLIRAIGVACKAEPSLNAWYFPQSNARHLISRIDVGIAVDTENGLIVPVMRNVGQREAADLRVGLNRLRADAAARAIPPEELRGATITLSNYGMIGGWFAYLTVVPPQVAIIGAGRAANRPAVKDGAVVIRRLLPLTLIFDHRVVTGGEGTRFLMALKADLEKPT